jgi:hypothetical protein
MRRILVQVAKAISKTKKSSRLKRFFLRVFTRSGKKNVAAIALARKVLCIIYHLGTIALVSDGGRAHCITAFI